MADEPVIAPDTIKPHFELKLPTFAWKQKAIEYGLIVSMILAGVVGSRFFPPTGPSPVPPAPLPEPTEVRPLVVADTVDAAVGRMTDLSAKSLGKISWIIPPGVAERLDNKIFDGGITLCPLVEDELVIGATVLWTPKDKPAEVYGPIWIKVRSGKGPLPPPGPGPTPPVPTPPVPMPPVPTPTPKADPALVLKLKAAMALDNDKDSVQKLTSVFQEGVDKLKASPPATLGEFYTYMFDRSEKAGVPRQPALANTRRVIGEFFGRLDETTPLVGPVLNDLSVKYRTVTDSLKEAQP